MRRCCRNYILAFVMVLIGTFVSMASSSNGTKALDPVGLAHLTSYTKAEVTLHPATGSARFVYLPAAVNGSLTTVDGSAKQKSDAFFKSYGSVFGITSPQNELT